MRAPWTEKQVNLLNRFQTESGMHPFTCGNSSGHGQGWLIATNAGWICTDCDYTQDWAHDSMVMPEHWPTTHLKQYGY